MNNPKISIITINYNDVRGLEQTIKSVISQTYNNIEYIIIDGESTDGSKKLIKKYASNFYYWVSEPDSGIYNAMNKGIKKATGDYVLFQNSGDWLYSKTIISEMSKRLNGLDMYYGNILAIYNNEKKVVSKGFQGEEITFKHLFSGMLPHPAVFYKRNLYDDLGYYDENYKILSDWKFLIHSLIFNNASIAYYDIIVCNYDMHGISSTNKELMVVERDNIFNEFLPNRIINDYKDYYLSEQLLNTNRFKILKELENSKISKKLLSLILRLLLRVFRNKSVSNL